MNEAQLFQQLVPLYYAETVGAEHVLRNRLYWNMQRMVLQHTTLPILVGKENSGMQVSLDKIPSMTKKFKNLAMENSFLPTAVFGCCKACGPATRLLCAAYFRAKRALCSEHI